MLSLHWSCTQQSLACSKSSFRVSSLPVGGLSSLPGQVVCTLRIGAAASRFPAPRTGQGLKDCCLDGYGTNNVVTLVMAFNGLSVL